MAKRGWGVGSCKVWPGQKGCQGRERRGERPGEQSCNQGGAGGKGRNPRPSGERRARAGPASTPPPLITFSGPLPGQHRQCWESL